MLRRIELETLATVERGDTISEIVTKLDHSENYLSRAVGDFVEKRPGKNLSHEVFRTTEATTIKPATEA